MKTALVNLTVSTVIALLPLAGLAQITNGLVAYYQFEGTANDTSGNNLTGTLINAGYAAGHSGQGLSTLGSLDSYCIVQPNDLLSPTNAVSVSLWFMERSYPTTPSSALFYKATKTPTSIGFSDRAYTLWIFNDGHFELTSTAVGDTSQEVCFSSPGLVQLNQFYHIVGIVDSKSQRMEIYLNSQLVGLRLYSPAGISSGGFPLLLGAPFQTLSDQGALAGVIDEVHIYNRALSASEVQALYNGYTPQAGCPRRAAATGQVNNGSVVGAAIIDGGCGYTNTPLVLIQGGGGTGATAAAVVSNGVVVNIVVNAGGIGYTSTPAIYVYSPFGLQIGLVKAVKPSFSDLLVGTNYQLQISSDLLSWTNQGAIFTATNPTTSYPQYWDVDNWGSLFFRLQISP